jgi:hypothetical protein
MISTTYRRRRKARQTSPLLSSREAELLTDLRVRAISRRARVTPAVAALICELAGLTTEVA